jgi:DNA polymerase elongation subunit (family B)
LINRITFQLGKEWADELSPIKRIYEKINQEGKFGMPSKEYVIEGISCLDYYVMYKKFAMLPLESYKLDYVGEIELGLNKISYDGSLAELARTDWNTYVEYNIQDVELLVKLDDKLRYIELIRFISYLGLCNMENAIKTVPVVNGAIAIRARHRDEKIPTFIRPQSDERIPGAYVAYPKKGFSENLVSFDANSLYPSVMISLNMSPETKIGKVEKINDKYIIQHVSGKTFELSRENYLMYIKEEKLAKSEADILFTQKRKGIMPEFLDFLYTKRKEMKSKMFEVKQEFQKNKKSLSKKEKSEIETTIQKLDTFQHAYKITLNSTYGYCANKYAPLGDNDIGSSVTLTGQSIIKKSNELFIDYIKNTYPNVYDKAESHLIYNDTDSCYISLKLLEEYDIFISKDGKITTDFYKVCDEIENHINVGCNEWAKRKLWSLDPRFVFKREAICDKGIFTGKKYYVLHILDDEGIPVDKFKYKGVSVVKTTMPKVLKPYVKKIMEVMILTQSLKETNDTFIEAYEIFKGLDVESIYKNSSVNNYEKYASQCKEFDTVKGMPAHVKAAYFHDILLDKLDISQKYQKFKSGEKVKSVYLKLPNKYGINMIGFKGKYPEEFKEVFEIDYEKMFDKLLYSSIEEFYNSVNWKLRKPNENVKIELEDFFN